MTYIMSLHVTLISNLTTWHLCYHLTKEWWTYSGVCPSHLNWPWASNLEGTLAENEWWKMSFKEAWWKCLPWLPAAQPVCTKGSTIVPQWLQECDWHRRAPSQTPMEILTVSPLIRRPNKDIGREFNQAPDSLVDTAKRQALALGSLAFHKRDCSRISQPSI